MGHLTEDLIFHTELMLMLGIVSGAFLTALRLGEFRIYGLLIAIGARMANSCNIKHLLGGLLLLSLQSPLFVGGLLVVLKEINTYRENLRNGKARLVIRTEHQDTPQTVPESACKMGYVVEINKVETFYEISIGGKQ